MEQSKGRKRGKQGVCLALACLLLLLAPAEKAYGLTNDTQVIAVEWETPAEIAAVEQQEKQFIVSTKTASGRVNNFYFTFPTEGGVRFHADEEGIFTSQEEGATIEYSAEELAIVMEANGTKVKLYTKEDPWRFEIYDAGGERLVEYRSDEIWFGYDEGNALRKVKIAAGIEENEVLFGLGERFGGFVQNGKTVEMWNTDSFAQLIRSYGDHNVGYKNIPLLHSSRGYSVFHNNTYYGIVDVGESDPSQYSFEFYGPILDLYIWTEQAAQNLAHYYELTGSVVQVPKWALSYWAGQSASIWLKEGSDPETVSETVFSRLDRYEEMNTPIRNLYGEGIAAKRELNDVVEEMNQRGIHVFGWMDSTWRSHDDAIKAQDILDLSADEMPIVMWADSRRARWWTPNDGANWTDYSDPAAVDWLKARFAPFLGRGLYGMMVDFNDAVGVDTYYPGNGGTGDWMHNFSAYYYDRAVDQVFRDYYGEGEYINFARAGCAGSQQYAAAFAGDQPSSFLGLEEVVSALLSSSASGIAIWGSDIGGLGASEDTQKHNPELYARWLEFGAFSPLMRAHGQTGWRDPWEYDNVGFCETLFQKYYWVRESLVDLIYSASLKASLENHPMTQAMVMAYPEEAELAANETQYLFCDSLLVSPVTQEGAASQTVAFPAGRWVSLWDGTVYEGGQTAVVSAALDCIPVYLAGGCAFPVVLGEELDLGTVNTVGKNAEALLVTPATELRENRILLSADESQSFLCDVSEEQIYSVEASEPCDRQIVVAMGAVADWVSVDGKELSELSERPDSASTKEGYYRDLDNTATILVTDGSWSRIEYTDSGLRRQNLALSGQVTVQGLSEKAAANSTAVTDGRYDTALPVSEAKGAEVVMDLGEERELDTVLIKWGGSYARGYVLETSCDGTSWSSVYEKKKGGGGTDTIVLKEMVRCRYLRITDVDISGKLDAQLVELEVYGNQTIVEGELFQSGKEGEFTVGTAAPEALGESLDTVPERTSQKQELPAKLWVGLVVVAIAMVFVGIVAGKKRKAKQAQGENPAQKSQVKKVSTKKKTAGDGASRKGRG